MKSEQFGSFLFGDDFKWSTIQSLLGKVADLYHRLNDDFSGSAMRILILVVLLMTVWGLVLLDWSLYSAGPRGAQESSKDYYFRVWSRVQVYRLSVFSIGAIVLLAAGPISLLAYVTGVYAQDGSSMLTGLGFSIVLVALFCINSVRTEDEESTESGGWFLFGNEEPNP